MGLPPELTGGEDQRHAFSPAAVLVLTDSSNDGVMLDRYDAEGGFAGDTWHTSVDDAKDQAEFEFGDTLSGWMEIPASVEDVVVHAIAQATASG